MMATYSPRSIADRHALERVNLLIAHHVGLPQVPRLDQRHVLDPTASGASQFPGVLDGAAKRGSRDRSRSVSFRTTGERSAAAGTTSRRRPRPRRSDPRAPSGGLRWRATASHALRQLRWAGRAGANTAAPRPATCRHGRGPGRGVPRLGDRARCRQARRSCTSTRGGGEPRNRGFATGTRPRSKPRTVGVFDLAVQRPRRSRARARRWRGAGCASRSARSERKPAPGCRAAPAFDLVNRSAAGPADRHRRRSWRGLGGAAAGAYAAPVRR